MGRARGGGVLLPLASGQVKRERTCGGSTDGRRSRRRSRPMWLFVPPAAPGARRGRRIGGCARACPVTEAGRVLVSPWTERGRRVPVCGVSSICPTSVVDVHFCVKVSGAGVDVCGICGLTARPRTGDPLSLVLSFRIGFRRRTSFKWDPGNNPLRPAHGRVFAAVRRSPLATSFPGQTNSYYRVWRASRLGRVFVSDIPRRWRKDGRDAGPVPSFLFHLPKYAGGTKRWGLLTTARVLVG